MIVEHSVRLASWSVAPRKSEEYVVRRAQLLQPICQKGQAKNSIHMGFPPGPSVILTFIPPSYTSYASKTYTIQTYYMLSGTLFQTSFNTF